MHFIFVSVTALAAAVSAMPAADIEQRQSSVCTGTYNTPQCCAVDVLGVADLNCANPPSPVKNQAQFVNECAVIGQQARCCLLPILDQALVCGDPLSA